MNCGGIGFNRLHVFNQTLFMKINLGLIQNSEALWMTVICSKYDSGIDGVPHIYRKTVESSIGNQVEDWR